MALGSGWWDPKPLHMWNRPESQRQPLVTAQGRLSSEPMFRLSLTAKLADGSTVVVATSDGSGWLAAGSPTTFNDIYLGEEYDARLEQPGWDSAGFRPSAEWKPAVLADPVRLGAMAPQTIPPIRRCG